MKACSIYTLVGRNSARGRSEPKRARTILVYLMLFSGVLAARGAAPVTDQELTQISQNSQILSGVQVSQLAKQLAVQQQQLAQLGKPQQYVNLLALDQFNASAQSLQAGVGQTASDYTQSADGGTALKYTGQGLYKSLSNMQDRQGNPVALNQDNFKKYAVVQSMYDNYTAKLKQYNAQMASLHQQLMSAMAKLNQAATQMEALKYHAQVSALDALINAQSSEINALGQSVLLQEISNQNDGARVIEAATQSQLQNRQGEITRFRQAILGQ